MPRPKGAKNCSNYHYEIHQLTPTGEYLHSKYFRSQQEICEFTGFSLSLINRLVADPTRTPRDKSRNIRVFRVQRQVVNDDEKITNQTIHKSDNDE